MVSLVRVILFFVLVDIVVSQILNDSFLRAGDVEDAHQKKKGHGRSTSSSSGEAKKRSEKSSDREETLEISDSSSSSSKVKKKTVNLKKSYKPKSSKERKGWKKWHRKCTPCPDDMRLKWRDPRIKWICGSYQRARRTFKSLCMMHYRNCQDGTMFTKMADHRCQNSTDLINIGQHFFYDYKVDLSDDSSKGDKTKSDETSSSIKESSSESWDSDKFGGRDMESHEFKNQIYVIKN